ncbi:MAG: hypothetical protein IPK24_07455 [Kineosporiaceae bacterium]|nr:hypothetical protein [Kineosporiaceae bacterium]
MTYRTNMSELAATLARSITAGSPIPDSDLDVALTGYQATLDLLRGIHRDLTGSSQHATPRLISEAERNPVGLLGTLLADIPRLAPLSPTEALTQPTRSGAGARWQQVTRNAVLAAGAWDAAGPTAHPTGQAAWTELADIAALTQGVLAASDDLATSLTHAGRHSDADAVKMDRQSGLGVAAEHTGRRATTTQPHVTVNLPPRRPPPPAAPQRPRPTRGVPPTHRPPARRQCRGARDVELIALTIATAAHQGSQPLARTGLPHDAALAGVLREHAELLARASDTTRRLATIAPSDPRPLAQAQGIHQLLAGMRRTTTIPCGRRPRLRRRTHRPDHHPGRRHPPPPRNRAMAHPPGMSDRRAQLGQGRPPGHRAPHRPPDPRRRRPPPQPRRPAGPPHADAGNVDGTPTTAGTPSRVSSRHTEPRRPPGFRAAAKPWPLALIRRTRRTSAWPHPREVQSRATARDGGR